MDKTVEFTKRDGSKHHVPVSQIESLSWWKNEEEAGLAFSSGDTVCITDRSHVMNQWRRLTKESE